MNLKDLATKPKLIKIALDDADTISQYGEALEFYTWDKQPMDTFLRIAKTSRDDMGELINSVKDLIMDAEGKAVMEDGTALPGSILVKAINKIVESLGK
jgi:hypothetical protein